jgi:hypothetical protein
MMRSFSFLIGLLLLSDLTVALNDFTNGVTLNDTTAVLDTSVDNCPPGFMGTICEIQGEMCGAQHCFHGGTCVQQEQPDGTIEDNCDCTATKTDTVSYGGEYCEAESTAFCAKVTDHNGKQFCVNGGTCKSES